MFRFFLRSLFIFFILSSAVSAQNFFNFSANGLFLVIEPTRPGASYPSAGIQLLPGSAYQFVNPGRDCSSLTADGFCLFSAGNGNPKRIEISGPDNGNIQATLCYNANARPATCQSPYNTSVSITGFLQFRQNNVPISSLSLKQKDSGSIQLFNKGPGTAKNPSLSIPADWTTYFTNTCSGNLPPNTSCTINYHVPIKPITGTHDLLGGALGVSNSPISLPITISILGSTLEFRKNNAPITSLFLKQGDTGSFQLFNKGPGILAKARVRIPKKWSTYFTSNCSGKLDPNAGCTVNYSIPVVYPITGKKNLVGKAKHASNSPLELPTTISLDGALKCWGNNQQGQLGNNNKPTDAETPVFVDGFERGGVQSISGGSFISPPQPIIGGHACALLTSGGLKCWGANDNGQLGNNNKPTDAETPVFVNGFETGGARLITTGSLHTCAILKNKRAKCWGGNAWGQLGNASPSDKSEPVEVALAGNVKLRDISSGNFHTCAVLSTGKVKCWGANSVGQLGTGSFTPSIRRIPVNTASLGGEAKSVALGADFSCALLKKGQIECWGFNRFGQLGIGSAGIFTNKNEPTEVKDLGGKAIQIATGNSHACALLESGIVQCWGRNEKGQLGIGSTGGIQAKPATVIKLPQNVVSITGGAFHACALLSNGEVWCWGDNEHGQLGNDNKPVDSNKPVLVDKPALGIAISIFRHNLGNTTCALIEPEA